MSEVDIVEVETPAHLKQFIALPNRLYRSNDNYVAPLNIERKEFFDTQTNPFYRSARTALFLAWRNGEPVGRIATCISYRHNEFHEEQVGFFGFFDTVDDDAVSRKLLKVAMITLKKAGMTKMRGPMNFSTNHECGFLVEGYDSPPMVMMPYNSPYQVKLAEAFGLKKAMDLIAYRLHEQTGISDRILSVVEKRKERSGITIRSLNMRKFEQEVDGLREVYNGAWARNWGFVPMDEAEFNHMAKNMKQIVDPRIVMIAEYEGKMIGFSLALPNINQALIKLNGRLFPFGLFKLLWHTKIRKTIDSCRIVTFGIIPEYQKRGVDMMLFHETFKQCAKHGYHWGELSWVLETNELMKRGIEQMQATPYKTYRILEMPL